MAYTTVSTTVDVDVDVTLDDFYDKDLIEELRSRGYDVYDKVDGKNQIEYIKDEVFNLKRDYLTCSESTFEYQLQQFFNKMLELEFKED
jgi:hypothetical protein